MESVLYKRMIENGNYFIGTNQAVFSVRRGFFLKTHKDKDGYVILPINQKKYKMHRLIYANFMGRIGEGLVINHIDLDKANNNISNLEAITAKENHHHALNTYSDGESGMFGSGHYRAKLNHNDVADIIRENPTSWNCQKKLAEKYGVSDCTIRDIIKRRSWKHLPRN